MFSFESLLSFAHLIGLILGVGAATVKLTLLLKCNTDYTYIPVYLKVARPITRQIILGLILLTLSGIGWLFIGYGFSTLLIVKIILVVAIWVLGPVIDNVVEPKFRDNAPAQGKEVSSEFIRIRNQYLTLEIIATLLFYVIIVIWVLI